MKTRPSVLLLASLLFASACLNPTSAHAVQRPTERQLLGSVEAVDLNRQAIKVRNAANSQECHWIHIKSRARVTNGAGQHVEIATLKAGDTVRVAYRSHWSAMRQASRITLR